LTVALTCQTPATLLLSMSSLAAIQPGATVIVPVHTDVVVLFFTQDELLVTWVDVWTDEIRLLPRHGLMRGARWLAPRIIGDWRQQWTGVAGLEN
jgi:hypothetical protein